MVESSCGISLVGTWRLLSREDVTCDGQRREEPVLGSDPIAYLMYDAAGHFAVQFMRRDRGRETGESLKAPVTGAMDGYDAYFGRYELGLDGTVRQELVGALSPGDVGKVVTRHYRVEERELVIELEVMNSGERLRRTLRWERVG
jgi:Lipocalin-like domain